jgi:N-acetylneuraminic acid mutarotase
MKRSTFRSAFFNPRVLIALLLCAAGGSSIVTGTLLAFLYPEAPTRDAKRTLTFEERVVYQRVIEDVYWRHRIWPKENPSSKPSLDSVISQSQLEKKVTDYLRNSQALEDYWQRAITAQQLQAEMDRMATHSKQTEVLQELFEALGNDPFVIAECLARPALANRLITNWYAYDQRIHADLKQRAETELQANRTVAQMKQLSGKYSEIELVRSDNSQRKTNRGVGHAMELNNNEWNEAVEKLTVTFSKSESQLLNSRDPVIAGGRPSRSARPVVALYQALPVGKPGQLQEDESRYYVTAVIKKTNDHLRIATVSWLKKPLQSWLTKAENQFPTAMPVPAGDYKLPTIVGGGCSEDTWTATAGPPDARTFHTAVWTGSEMIVWGGAGHFPYLNTGGRYNPATDNWEATTTTNATARGFHTAVWTGNEMIVWGGDDDNNLLNSGGRYNPITNSWVPTSTTNAPVARSFHTAVWTGSQMIVWGGSDGGSSYFNTGGRYDPNTDSWSATSMTNVPGPRQSHTAVWTGTEMIVWGGTADTTGGRYNPVTNSWTATSTTNAPDFRYYHTAVWTGSEMVVWGGENLATLNTGGRYNPSTNSWTATSIANAPDGRKNHTAVWTGSEMIVWGGRPEISFGELNTGGRYNPISNSWTPTSTANAPAARIYPTAVWTGSEMIVWGGTAGLFGSVIFNTGGRYNPGANSWVNTNDAPLGRSSHTAMWTGSEMIVWGGNGEEFPHLNTGEKYGPATDTWTATSTTDAPEGRALHTAVWTGSEMIVWGGQNSLFLNNGARYNPVSDSWTPTTTVNAPAGRYFHTAIWTGSEMIIWGGDDENFLPLNTGGRYNPSTDNWTATSTTNAPNARIYHTAVSTGSEMIVWGGYDNENLNILNTGGTYDPGTDSWLATDTANAPVARYWHTAIWTGNEMIVWAGSDTTQNCCLNTGGKYDPGTNSWTATSTANAPDGRASHTAVWTGSEMVVWGGSRTINGGPEYLNTGGAFNPEADTWTDTSIINAPGARDGHTAVWTGSEMIVWGGGPGALVSGGARYCARSAPTPTPTPCIGRCSPTPRPRPTPAPRP